LQAPLSERCVVLAEITCDYFVLGISAWLGKGDEAGYDDLGAPTTEAKPKKTACDGNLRPLVSDEQNPTRRRAPLVVISTPQGKADIGGVRRACQMHRCTLTCLPKNFKKHSVQGSRGHNGRSS
jgi:hypothetical protein